MKRTKRLICLLLVCVLTLSMFSFQGFALDVAPAGNLKLETMALSYIKKYVDATLLYYSEDLKTDTILMTAQDASAASTEDASVDAEVFALGEEQMTVAQLRDDITTFERCADYLKYMRSKQGFKRYNFTYSPEVVETVVNEDTAYVHIYTNITFQYDPSDEEFAEMGDNYVVWFVKVDGQWYIAKVWAEELEVGNLPEKMEDYDAAIAEFDAWYAQNETLKAAEAAEAAAAPEADTAPMAYIGAYDRAYNGVNAAAYGSNYSTTTYTASSGNDSKYVNPLFPEFEGANCQNFVSQCLWAGFGGINEKKRITGQDFPMDTTGPNVWYYDRQGGTWAHTKSMLQYLLNSKNETTGMLTNYTGTANQYTGSLEGYSGALSTLVGAPLYISEDQNYANFSHVVLITDASGKTFDKIKFCGNSPMRRATMLSEDYSKKMVCLVIPTAMKDGRTCSNGTHVFKTGDGLSIDFCRYCGYNKMKVTGNMLCPIKHGKSATLSGSVNVTCYRMAMCVTTPSGSKKWIEKLNTSSISQTYTFNETGMYTVKIVARDLDPTTFPDYSVDAVHTFTIRVW